MDLGCTQLVSNFQIKQAVTYSNFSNGYGLLVGVGDDLPVTVKDATALYEILTNPARAAYPVEQVRILTSEKATKSNILQQFDELAAQVKQNPQATVIIYYSGHGGYVPNTEDYYLVPYGYDANDRNTTAISGWIFTEKIEAIQAQKLVVLLDCCHAAGIPKDSEQGLIKSPIPPDLLARLEAGTGRVVVASSRADEKSYINDQGTYSIFTACLLQALRGKAAVQKDSYVRILDLLVYLFDQVPKQSRYPQHPVVKKILDLGDNFPLCYYAGGSKSLPDEVSVIEPEPTYQALTMGQNRRLEQRREALQQEWNLRSELVRRMRQDLVIQTGTAIKFQLEQQLLVEEAALAQLAKELEEIEHQL
jgi:hypothetical protein